MICVVAMFILMLVYSVCAIWTTPPALTRGGLFILVLTALALQMTWCWGKSLPAPLH